jgi:hypothetical protein
MLTAVGSSYLVECYWPGLTAESVDLAMARASGVARELGRTGREVRVIGSVFVPSDEVVFCLFAGSRDDVEAVSTHAELPFDRVLECVTSGAPLPSDGDEESRWPTH